MNILDIGVDIVEIDRIKEVIEEKGKTSSYNNEIAFKLKKSTLPSSRTVGLA